MSTPPLVSREGLDRLFNPRSLALVGASDKSPFSRLAYGMSKRFGARDRTFLINPRSPEVHGTATLPSCSDVPGGLDCAYVMVPRDLVIPSIEEAAAAGAKAAVILTGGFAETGPEGMAAQDELVDRAVELGITFLGPNHLGFANIVGGTVACALPELTTTAGPLALVSQSGAIAGLLLKYASEQGIHFSYVVTTGNEAMVTVEDVLDYLVDDPTTKAVAVFAEVIRRPDLFRTAVTCLRAVGKAVVILKAGSSELSARTAAAHTGALTGDDRVIDAMFAQEGVIRVGQLEELLVTGNVVAHTGPWRTPGVAFASISGGACDVIADRGAEAGLVLPELAEVTQERLRGRISALGAMHNPLDVTGAALMDATLFGDVVAALAKDPGVGFVGAVTDLPSVDDPINPPAVLDNIGQALAGAPDPGAFVDSLGTTLKSQGRDQLAKHGLPFYLPSLRDAVTSLSKIGAWSERVRELEGRGAPAVRPAVAVSARAGEALSEASARDLLAAADIPVVPGGLAASEDEAVKLAADAGGDVALKIVSPDIAHKTEIGGVVLGVQGEELVRAAYRRVRSSADALSPAPRVEGVLVTTMRTGGVELLVGVVRDPAWGPVLAVGTGGIFVEVLQDARLLLLPAHEDDVRAAVLGLRSAPLLQGARGLPPADIDELARVVTRIGDLALALGDELEALEVNPLRIDGGVVEALDALVTWRTPLTVGDRAEISVDDDPAGTPAAARLRKSVTASTGEAGS